MSVFQAYLKHDSVGSAVNAAAASAQESPAVASTTAAEVDAAVAAAAVAAATADAVEKLAAIGPTLSEEDLLLGFNLADRNLYRAEELIRCADVASAAAAADDERRQNHDPGKGAGSAEGSLSSQQKQHSSATTADAAAADAAAAAAAGGAAGVNYVQFAHLALSSLGPAAADAITAANVLRKSDWTVEGVRAMCTRVQSARKWEAKNNANLRFESLLASAEAQECTQRIHAAAAAADNQGRSAGDERDNAGESPFWTCAACRMPRNRDGNEICFKCHAARGSPTPRRPTPLPPLNTKSGTLLGSMPDGRSIHTKKGESGRSSGATVPPHASSLLQATLLPPPIPSLPPPLTTSPTAPPPPPATASITDRAPAPASLAPPASEHPPAPVPAPASLAPATPPERPWIVIVAGESPGTSFATAPNAAAGSPGRPGADLSGHTSLLHVGHAYQELVPLVGRGRIIVIAQLEETMEWLEQCTASPDACRRMTGLAPRRSVDGLLASNKRRLAKMREECACLIADGGADYDREHVNPSTVVRVLTGEPLHRGDKVVPKGAGQGCSSIILLMYSHGGSHSRRYPPRVDEDEEHFLGMPYPAAPEDEANLYGTVPFRGSFTNYTDAEIREGGRWLAFDEQGQAAMNKLAASSERVGVVETVGCKVEVDLNAKVGTGFETKPWQQSAKTKRPIRSTPLSEATTPTSPVRRSRPFSATRGGGDARDYEEGATRKCEGSEDGAVAGGAAAGAGQGDVGIEHGGRDTGTTAAESRPYDADGDAAASRDAEDAVVNTASGTADRVHPPADTADAPSLDAAAAAGEPVLGAVDEPLLAAAGHPVQTLPSTGNQQTEELECQHWEWFRACGPEGTWSGVPARHRYFLYASTLALAYNKVFRESPNRRMVVLNHFCLSGGMSHFLRKRQWREYVGTATWPIYCMVTCDDFEVSVAPEFWAAWIRSFVEASRHPTRGDTLGGVYRQAEREYWEKNKGIVTHNATTPPAENRKEPLSFGTVAAYQGNAGMENVPCWDIVVGGDSGATRWRRMNSQQKSSDDDASAGCRSATVLGGCSGGAGELIAGVVRTAP